MWVICSAALWWVTLRDPGLLQPEPLSLWQTCLGNVPLLETPGHSQASLGQSLVGSLLLSPGSWCTQGSVWALQESIFPVLCKFWQLSDRVTDDLFQEGLCHTHVCCTQSPCPCNSPLLTCTSTGDAQTQFCLSLCGVSGSWCTQGFFELFERPWWEWGLLLNTI